MKFLVQEGMEALVDDEDVPKILDYNWWVREGGYLIGIHRATGERVRLHRLITGATDGQVVDHINREPLDNRKANLRCVTQSQNMGNCVVHCDKKTSSFKGVYRHSDGARWFASCANKYLGTFDSEIDAAAAYDHAARARWGECARPNFKPAESQGGVA